MIHWHQVRHFEKGEHHEIEKFGFGSNDVT